MSTLKESEATINNLVKARKLRLPGKLCLFKWAFASVKEGVKACQSILCVFLSLQIGGRRHMELKNTQKGDEGLGMRESVDLDTMYL